MENSITIDSISKKIYEIRGVQVMLDSDLADLYHVETKQINRQVKRNINRFDSDFMFQLSEIEYQDLKYQFGTSSNTNHGGRRTLPYVFTEEGVAMLAGILHSEIAINMSKSIIRAFVLMRKYISHNLLEQSHINNLVYQHDKDIKIIQNSIAEMNKEKSNNEIFFNGQIYDAYNKVFEILNEAKNNLIIIDSYADNNLLNIIKRLNANVLLITTTKYISNDDINKYNLQYHNLRILFNNSFHDRFFILDSRIVYHCGASINRIGYKTFAINVVSDINQINALINHINKLKD